MSEMAPLDAGFDLSIRGFGQASGGARARRGVTAASQTQRRGRAGGGDGGSFFDGLRRLCGRRIRHFRDRSRGVRSGHLRIAH